MPLHRQCFTFSSRFAITKSCALDASRRALRKKRREMVARQVHIPLTVAIVAILSFAMAHPFQSSGSFSYEDEWETNNTMEEVLGAYTYWTLATGTLCPEALSDLNDYRNNELTTDAWGRELLMLCGGVAQAASGIDFAVVSAGPDGYFGSSDDMQMPPG
jgi:hypothetical protein